MSVFVDNKYFIFCQGKLMRQKYKIFVVLTTHFHKKILFVLFDEVRELRSPPTNRAMSRV